MYPLIVPVFNNPTYLKNFYQQVKLLNFSRIDIYDNASTYPPMVQLLKDLEGEPKVSVLRLEKNMGPHYVLRNPEVFASLDEIFCLSDPDIEFSPDLPENFLSELKEISDNYKIGKVGFAIEIPKEEEFEILHVKMDGKMQNMHDWESKFWQSQVGKTVSGDAIYDATIDTTFALYNKKYFNNLDRYKSLRVAGRYISKHLGFYKNYEIPQEERDFYKSASKYSYFSGRHDSSGNPTIEISVHEYTLMVEALESATHNNRMIALERDRINKKLQEIYQSKSWLITKPFRDLKASIRKGMSN